MIKVELECGFTAEIDEDVLDDVQNRQRHRDRHENRQNRRDRQVQERTLPDGTGLRHLEDLVEAHLAHADRRDDRPKQHGETDESEFADIKLVDALERDIGKFSRLLGKHLGGGLLLLQGLLLLGSRILLRGILALALFDIGDHRIDLLVDLVAGKLVDRLVLASYGTCPGYWSMVNDKTV